MSASAQLVARLHFLVRVVEREMKHLLLTDRKLFPQPLTANDLRELEANEALAERVEAYVARFGRLQDTLGDKLLPSLLLLLGERPAAAIDNLDRAERLGWIGATDDWFELRKLRNQMVHEYIEDPAILADALNAGHRHVPDLIDAAERMLTEVRSRLSAS